MGRRPKVWEHLFHLLHYFYSESLSKFSLDSSKTFLSVLHSLSEWSNSTEGGTFKLKRIKQSDIIDPALPFALLWFGVTLEECVGEYWGGEVILVSRAAHEDLPLAYQCLQTAGLPFRGGGCWDACSRCWPPGEMLGCKGAGQSLCLERVLLRFDEKKWEVWSVISWMAGAWIDLAPSASFMDEGRAAHSPPGWLQPGGSSYFVISLCPKTSPQHAWLATWNRGAVSKHRCLLCCLHHLSTYPPGAWELPEHVHLLLWITMWNTETAPLQSYHFQIKPCSGFQNLHHLGMMST